MMEEHNSGIERRHESVLCFKIVWSWWVGGFHVWFPAAWMPLVVDAIRAKMSSGGRSKRFGPACSSQC